MPFEFEEKEIKGVVLVKPRVFDDSRGFFLETYEKSSFEKAGIKMNIIQSNHSYSNGILVCFLLISFEGFLIKVYCHANAFIKINLRFPA